MNELKEITLKLDQKTINYLQDETRLKRTAGRANSFSDRFLIRLVEALNNNNKDSIFKVKDNNLNVRNIK